LDYINFLKTHKQDRELSVSFIFVHLHHRIISIFGHRKGIV
jgi:hypothetical protein